MVPRLLQPVEPQRVETRQHRGKRPTRGADSSDLQSLLPPSLLPGTSPSHHPSLFSLLESLCLYLFFKHLTVLLCFGFFPCISLAFQWDFQLLEVRDHVVFCVSSRHSVHMSWHLGGREEEPGALVPSWSGTGCSLTRGSSPPSSGVWRARASCSRIGISESLGHLPRFIHSAKYPDVCGAPASCGVVSRVWSSGQQGDEVVGQVSARAHGQPGCLMYRPATRGDVVMRSQMRDLSGECPWCSVR